MLMKKYLNLDALPDETVRTLSVIANERRKQREEWGDDADDAKPRCHLTGLIWDRASDLSAIVDEDSRGPRFTEERNPQRLAVEIAALCLAWLDREDRLAARQQERERETGP